LSLLPAWLSFRFVENAIRFSRSISGRRVLQLAAGCVVASIVACGGLLGFRHVVARTDAFQDYAESQIPHYASYSCPANERACAPTRSKGTVMLIGDSNAGMLGEPVLRAATHAGFDVRLTSSSACPFANLRVVRPNRPLPAKASAACRRFYAENMQTVLRIRPSLVIAAARTDRYIDDPTFGIAAPRSGAVRYSAAAKERIWIRGLESTLRTLRAARIRVVVVQPVPVVQATAVSGCAAGRILANACATSASRSAVDRYLAQAIEANSAAVAAVDHTVTTIDFRNALCSDGRCPSQRGDVVLYRDRYHLSVAGSLLLTGAFYRTIRADARNAPA